MLKAFLKIKFLFERYEPRYLLNILYIDDFCLYIQSISIEIFENLANEIDELKISTKDLDLNLDNIEKLAQELIDEENNQMEIDN